MYGLILAWLVFLLKYVEYRYFVRELSVEIYIGVIATLFTLVGIWIGLKVVRKKKHDSGNPIFVTDQKALKNHGISNREYDVLVLIAKGYSNQEIADQLFISLPTVKTHSSNLFEKLNVQRRTQAIRKARELQIIP